MNQLSLFADLAPAPSSTRIVLQKAEKVVQPATPQPVQPRVDTPRENDCVPSTSAVDVTVADITNDGSGISNQGGVMNKANEDVAPKDTLMKLAELIRQGRDQMEAQSRLRSRPVQSIGDLAQAVLLRHDLVARRRSASRAAVSRSSNSQLGVAVQGNLTGALAEVHVAS